MSDGLVTDYAVLLVVVSRPFDIRGRNATSLPS
jgi:hypothetical protein